VRLGRDATVSRRTSIRADEGAPISPNAVITTQAQADALK